MIVDPWFISCLDDYVFFIVQEIREVAEAAAAAAAAEKAKKEGGATPMFFGGEPDYLVLLFELRWCYTELLCLLEFK